MNASLPLTGRRHGFRATDACLMAMVVSIVSLMVLPMPLLLMDGLIAVNIMLSLGLLMLAAYVPSVLALSTFPALLLFTTLLRLSLNIASTKNILLHANAGHIIETFGSLVMGGNVVVGLVVFIIISIVQFIVIAKGSERVAEVGARFCLDAMPGKQMSIDADLRAGLLSKEDARSRRSLLEKESQLHGAMDGAMKFVKGDAIAGLIVALVNVVGGIVVGMVLRGMPLAEAASRFVLLSIGDGMVSQIPSLFVSIAAGVLVTRVSSGSEGASDLGKDVSRQIVSQPLALLITGSIMLLFVAVPGFPKPVFALLGGGLVAAGSVLRKRAWRPARVELTPMPSFAREGSDVPVPLICEDRQGMASVLSLELPEADVARLDAAALDAAMQDARDRVKRTLGLPFPGLALRTDAALPAGTWRLLVGEVPLASVALRWGEVLAGRSEALDAARPRDVASLDGWTWQAQGAAAAEPGRVLLSPEQVLGMVVGRALVKYADHFIGMQEVQRLLDAASQSLPGVVEELNRSVPLPRVASVLRRLVQEGISIRHQREIFESLINWGPKEKDIVLLIEYVRIDIGSATAFQYGKGRDLVPAIIVEPSLEDQVRGAIQQSAAGNYLAFTADQTQAVAQRFDEAMRGSGLAAEELVVVCSMDVRRYMAKLLLQEGLAIPVLSFQELASHVQLQPVANVSAPEELAP